MSPPTELLTIRPSTARRALGVGTLLATAVLLLGVVIFAEGALVWDMVLGAISLGALWLAWTMWRATSQGLVLTTEALTEEDGTVLAELTDIVRVDRGAFAFKPSNGFLLHTRRRLDRHWAPGLWWRVGRRIGVGGVLGGGGARAMAELLTAAIAGTMPPK